LRYRHRRCRRHGWLNGGPRAWSETRVLRRL
jgi:hypothetical protein